MGKVVRSFENFRAADQADLAYWRRRSGEERLTALLELIMPENPDEAVIERSARVYPLARKRRGCIPLRGRLVTGVSPTTALHRESGPFYPAGCGQPRPVLARPRGLWIWCAGARAGGFSQGGFRHPVGGNRTAWTFSPVSAGLPLMKLALNEWPARCKGCPSGLSVGSCSSETNEPAGGIKTWPICAGWRQPLRPSGHPGGTAGRAIS